MWVKFTAEHWHRFNAQAKTRYRAGMTVNVPTIVANKAVGAGHAVKMRRSSKAAKPEQVGDEASVGG